MEADINMIGGPLLYGIPKIFHVILLPILKVSFFFKLEWLKILKDIFKGSSVARGGGGGL